MTPLNAVLIVIIVTVLVFIVFNRKKINDDLFKIYLYRKDDFPLNIYFANTAQTRKNFKTLHAAVYKAAQQFNATFDFKFFVCEDNIKTYSNVVTIQIACGAHKGCLSSFDGEGGILAHATYPPWRLVCVDCKDINFKPLHIVLMHEFGHIIGLRHTKKGIKSLMNSHIDPKADGFTAYDIQLVRSIYPFVARE